MTSSSPRASVVAKLPSLSIRNVVGIPVTPHPEEKSAS
jgi:hypothetical protein